MQHARGGVMSGDDLFSTPKLSQSSTNSNLRHLQHSSDSNRLWVPFGGGRTLGAAFRGGVGRGVGMEGECGSVGGCWKGFGTGSPFKCLWNWEAVGVREMLKVSEVGVGRTPRQVWSGKQVVP